MINLSQYYAVKNLFRSWKKTYGKIEMTKDHQFSWSKHTLVFPRPPVPGEPLEIHMIHQVKLIHFIINFTIILVSNLGAWTLPWIILSPHNICCFFDSCQMSLYSSHRCKINCSKFELKTDWLICLPFLPLRFKQHTRNAIKLFPFSTLFLIKPCPV